MHSVGADQRKFLFNLPARRRAAIALLRTILRKHDTIFLSIDINTQPSDRTADHCPLTVSIFSLGNFHILLIAFLFQFRAPYQRLIQIIVWRSRGKRNIDRKSDFQRGRFLFVRTADWTELSDRAHRKLHWQKTHSSDIVSILPFPNRLSLNTEKVDVKFHIRVSATQI